MPSSQAIGETEILWILVPGQLVGGAEGRHTTLQDAISMKKMQLGVVAHACHPSYGQKHKIGRLQSRLA
jgi:hypothetical protein